MNIKTIDMDTLIDIFSQLAKQKDEFTEQDAAGGESAGSSSGGKAPLADLISEALNDEGLLWTAAKSK